MVPPSYRPFGLFQFNVQQFSTLLTLVHNVQMKVWTVQFLMAHICNLLTRDFNELPESKLRKPGKHPD